MNQRDFIDEEFIVPDESEEPYCGDYQEYPEDPGLFMFTSEGQGEMFCDEKYRQKEPGRISSNGLEFRDSTDEKSKIAAMQFYTANQIAIYVNTIYSEQDVWENIEKKIMDLVVDAWNHVDVRKPKGVRFK